MANPPPSDHQCKTAYDLYQETKNYAEVARRLGQPRSTIQGWVAAYNQRNLKGDNPPGDIPAGFRLYDHRATYDKHGELKGQTFKTGLEPGGDYERPDNMFTERQTVLVDGDNRVHRVWYKEKAHAQEVRALIDALKETFNEYTGHATIAPAPDATDADLLSVYPIADQHHGMMAWSHESGEDYDIQIGSERLRACMRDLVAQSPPSGQAIILNLGDWTHQNDHKQVTPGSGHQLDLDSRYFKVLKTGVQLMLDCIDLALQRHAQVLVRNLPGNHDPDAAFALTLALSAFYDGHDRVTIDEDPSDFFFYRHGRTLIGANHGHKIKKPQDMAMLLASMRREDWGATDFRHWYFGHIHHETAKEVGGVRCESFQTLAARDAYTASHGYVAGNSLTSITHHIEDGEIGRHRVNIRPVRSGK